MADRDVYEVTLIVAGLDAYDNDHADAVYALTQDVTIGNVAAEVAARVSSSALAEIGVCEDLGTLREAFAAAQTYLEIMRMAVPDVELVEILIRRDEDQVAAALSRLDGTTTAKVAVLADLEDSELDELGGLG